MNNLNSDVILKPGFVAPVETWNTGRTYTFEGQRMAAVLMPGTRQVAFTDVDRQIKGITKLAYPSDGSQTIPEFLMEEYDKCDYTGDFWLNEQIGTDVEISGFTSKLNTIANFQLKNESIVFYGTPTETQPREVPRG